MFSQMIKAIFAPTKRLMLVLSLLLTISAVYAEGDKFYAKLTVGVSGTGTGKGSVYVTSKGKTEDEKSTNNSGGEITFSINATPDSDSYLDKWSVTKGSVTIPNDTSAIVKASTKKDGYEYYGIDAVFQKVITIAKENVTIVKTEGSTAQGSVGFTVYGGAENVTPTITSAQASHFTCSVAQGEDNTKWTLTITATADAEQGDGGSIKLTTVGGSRAGATNVVYFTVKEQQQIQLVGAPNGIYTAYQTVLGQSYTMSSAVTDTTKISLDSDDAFSFKFDFTPTTNYRLNRLKVTMADTLYYLYDDADYDGVYTLSTTFAGSAVVEPEFTPLNYAMFIVVGGDTAIHYKDWDRAFAEAKRLGKTVVSVYQPCEITAKLNSKGYATSITLPTGYQYQWKLPKPKSGTYTVPEGYTLLVPGLDKSNLTGTASTTKTSKMGYTSLSGATGKDDYISTNPGPKCICKLIVESGTIIQVNGNISIYSCISAQQGFTGRPTGYGQLHLENGSHIQVNNGAKLHVLGYITGTPTESSVTAKAGSDIYESFQFTDWRGGNGMAGGNVMNFMSNKSATLVDNQYAVFPIGQYYVQSIETKLLVESGATEWLATAVDVGGLVIPVTTEFINQATTNEDLGLFALGTGTILEKYYDTKKDRLKINVLGNGSTAKLSYMYMQLTINVGELSDVLGDNMGGGLGGIIGGIGGIIGGNKEEDISLDSRNYVIPINNNIDVLVDGVTVDVPYRTAFMAGSSMTVTSDAILNIKNEMYVYDRELNVQPDSAHRGYYGSGSNALQPITYTAHHGKAPGIRKNEKMRYPTDTAFTDATLTINGTLTMADNGALYTTTYGSAVSEVKETTDKDRARVFGANITSEGGGVLNFKHIGTKTTTNQIKQIGTTIYWVTNIPVCNAWLRNADGTRSGGTDAKEGDTYMYMDGKWEIPDANIRNPKGNEFYITLPKDTIQTITCEVMNHGVTIKNISIKQTDGTNFFEVGELDLQGDSLLVIPVKYKHVRKHNVGAPNTGKIILTITYDDPLKTDNPQTKDVEIPLTATEDYKPAFSVAIVNQLGDTVAIHNGDTYSMAGLVNIPTTAKVILTPAKNNVAQTLTEDGWKKNVAAPFDFTYGATSSTLLTDAKLTYTAPEAGAQSGTLQLTASYTDATKQPVDSTITIRLMGTGEKSKSSLAFIPSLTTLTGDSIFQTQTIDAIFATMGNSNEVTFTYNGETASELVSIEPYNGNYRLIAHEVTTVDEPQVITIVAKQAEDAAMLGTELTIQLTVLPQVAWNWGTLYFNSTTTTKPVITYSNDLWTLVVESDPNNLITSLTPDATNGYVATIGTPADATQTYTATFKFKQGNYTKVFTSNIYADPRILPYCVDNERTYKDVTVETNPVAAVTYATGVVSFASTAEATSSWTIALSGVPHQLTFTPLISENAWRIEEWDGAAWTTTYNLDAITANEAFTHSLRPNTQRIRITYAAGNVSTGQLSNICITALENVKANTSKIYIPIAKDAAGNVVPTTQKVVLYSVVNKDLSISLSSNDLSLDVTSLPAKTGAYTRQEVTITNNGNSEAEAYLYVKDGTTTLLTLPIRPFEFRQGLPINLSQDPVERYYFLTTASSTDTWANNIANVRWDATNKAIVFQNPAGTGTTDRSITLAYEGAADYVEFYTSAMVDLTKWVIEESADGNAWGAAVDSLKTLVNEGQGIHQELRYTTRYVRITYKNTDDYSKVLVTNLKLEGTPHLIVNPVRMSFTDDTEESKLGLLTMTAINLEEIRVVSNSPENFKILYDENDLSKQVSEFTATATAYPHALGKNKVGDVMLGVAWQALNTLDDATLTIYNNKNHTVLATISLLGTKGMLTPDNADTTGIFTGIPKGYTYHGATYTDYTHHPVNLTNTFATDGTALFDYLFIYGETTPASGTNITPPGKGSANASTNVGSNAVTPYYIYKRAAASNGKYVGYQFAGKVDNANVALKDTVEGIITTDSLGTVYIPVNDTMRVYMTGFCPYATTGYQKNQEGVFLFRGKHRAKLDVYLEDFHVFSRNKTEKGNGFYGDKEGGRTFSEKYARGSGGVLVFENTDAQEQLGNFLPFEVNVHTVGHNLLKSNYGCFFALVVGGVDAMKAYQISAPISIHMQTDKHVRQTKTTLNFDDCWPTAVDANDSIIVTKRTNGYLGLKKQSNNAPSIDMGNPHTIVNFNGGRVELQNAQIVSSNYKTTLAISHRSGYYGGDDAGIQLSFGIGTDSVGGTVNFLDGTVTVEPMWVKEGYKQYYLIDTLDGKEITKNVGTAEKPVYEYQTSCLRTPKNTYVRGGSHCRIRACQHVTSKGGAPRDKEKGSFLGQYVYTAADGYTLDTVTKLVTQINFPNSVAKLPEYHNSRNYTYGLHSITPDADGNLYFWIPDGYGGVEAEQDKFLSTWKACMTEIRAGLAGVVEGGVGGDTPVEPNEEIKYFLYCQIDKNIHDVINRKDSAGHFLYQAPVAVPSVAKDYFEDQDYTTIAPTQVGDSLQYQVTSDTTYTITDRVYYVTNTIADIWQTFTAPFDVENIYVVETYDEEALSSMEGGRSQILLEQARHNADFAAFFAVAMAIGTTDDFEGIYNSYIKWAKNQDGEDDNANYTKRGKKKLIPYIVDPATNKGNWRDANFYLNQNSGDWSLNQTTDEYGNTEYAFTTQWRILAPTDTTDGILLHKGETYSMQFPYCTGCGDLASREEWDYWSGKFLIFESTKQPQTINGRDFLNDTIAGNIFATKPDPAKAIVMGNSTFAQLQTEKQSVFVYDNGYPALNSEGFTPNDTKTTIMPTTAFLYGDVPTNAQGMPARRVKRTGEIIYDKQNTPTDNQQGGTPTIGGGNTLFITETANGINIAVAEPQHVRVLSSTGVLLYNGMVQNAVDVTLPTAGVYVVAGENEVQKILF